MKDLTISTTELYNAVATKFPIPEIHPLHRAMIMECCENALKSKAEKDLDTLISILHLEVLSCDSLLKGVLKGCLQRTDADFVQHNYRSQTFSISRNSSILES